MAPLSLRFAPAEHELAYALLTGARSLRSLHSLLLAAAAVLLLHAASRLLLPTSTDGGGGGGGGGGDATSVAPLLAS